MPSRRFDCNIALRAPRVATTQQNSRSPEFAEDLVSASVFQSLPEGRNHIVFLSRCAVGYRLCHCRSAFFARPVPASALSPFWSPTGVANEIGIVFAGKLQAVVVALGIVVGRAFGVLARRMFRISSIGRFARSATLGKDDGGGPQNAVRD